MALLTVAEWLSGGLPLPLRKGVRSLPDVFEVDTILNVVRTIPLTPAEAPRIVAPSQSQRPSCAKSSHTITASSDANGTSDFNGGRNRKWANREWVLSAPENFGASKDSQGMQSSDDKR